MSTVFEPPTAEQFRRKRNAKAMLERISRVGPLLELAILAAGGSSYNTLRDLRNWKFAARCEHPTVRDAFGYPADAIAITESGRQILKAAAAQPSPHKD